MQAAAGSVSWVAAQPSVLGRCGAPSASLKGSAYGVGGGGCRVRGRDVAVPRCCARAQEKRPPRVRKSKEERREMVESFINSYRLSNEGKFPSVNLTHKEVGGSYYIVREIVRDIIQENRVLGPGGLDAMALSFEDCADSSESSVKHELGQDSIEILDISGSEVSKGYVPEISSTDESFPLQDNAISTHTLLGSANILEACVLNSFVQNGSAADAVFMETNLEKQDEVPSGGSIDFDLNSPSEEQARLFAQVSDSDEDIALSSQADAQDGTTSSATDKVIIPLESSAVYEKNAAPLRDHETLPNDNHDGSTDGSVDDTNLLVATNGVQAKQASLHEHDASTGSVSIDNAQSLDGQFSTTVSTDPINGSKLEAEVATKTVEASKVKRLQDEFEQSLLDANRDGQENSDSPVSHPALHTKGLLHTDQHSVIQVDESEFKNSTFGITKEEVQAADFRHEQEIGTRTAISRKTLKALQKKDDNLFWLVLRAFIVAISKIWAK